MVLVSIVCAFLSTRHPDELQGLLSRIVERTAGRDSGRADGEPPHVGPVEGPVAVTAGLPVDAALSADAAAAESGSCRSCESPSSGVRLVTGFECSKDYRVEAVGEDHFAVWLDGTNWFMFRIENAKGREVRIDLKRVKAGHWWSVNPVYCHADDLKATENYVSLPPGAPVEPVQARNRSMLPDTRGQRWHFIPNVWIEEREEYRAEEDSGTGGKRIWGDLCFKHEFETESAYVAMRYPYTPAYSDLYFADLAGRIARGEVEDVEVHEVGRSSDGRAVRIVKIGRGGGRDERRKPCFLLYAREDGTEHDTSWAAEGVIEFLASRDEKARKLRSEFTFLVIPMLDPDGSARCIYKNICYGFVDANETKETRAYAAWFRRWIEDGKRLDLIVNLHNVEGGQVRWHAFPVLQDYEEVRARALDAFVLKYAKPAMAREGLGTKKSITGSGMATFRLGGFLASFYGPLHIGYELNAQSPARHLTLEEVRRMGAVFATAAADFLMSDDFKPALTTIRTRRAMRDARVRKHGGIFEETDSPLLVEWECWRRSPEEDEGE
jgi:hypothetical protein